MMPMDKNTWPIALLFAGAAVGGSYLSGYEWLRFFAFFGTWGAIGIVLTGIGLAWFGSTVLAYCHRHQIGSLHELICRWFNEAVAPGISVLTHLLLLSYAGAMIGSFVLHLTGVTFTWLFVFVIVLAAALLLLRGWTLLVSSAALSLAGGFLLFALLFLEQRHVPIPSLGYQLNGYWIIHALSYLGLHSLLCLMLTIPLAKRARGEATVRFGVYAGSAGFLVFALLGQAVLLAHWHDVHNTLTPVTAILERLSPLGSWLHALLSLLHIAVIAAALVFALAQPLSKRHHLQLVPLLLLLFGFILVFALLATAFPSSFTFIATGATYCGFLLLVRALFLQRKSP